MGNVSLLEGIENPSVELIDLELEVIKTDEKIDKDWRQRRQERREAKVRKHRQSGKIAVLLCAVTAFIVGAVFTIGGDVYGRQPWAQKFTDHYIAAEQPAPDGSVYTIVVEQGTTVRSDPIRNIYERTSYTGKTAAAGWGYNTYEAHTAYGTVEGIEKLEITVSSIYRPEGAFIDSRGHIDCGADEQYNGPYVGVSIRDLDEDTLRRLPRYATKDNDGVIWFSEKYSDVQIDEIIIR
ncbi:hypothetical protein IKF15_00975 [Candidatus Saccharibacteria bacterium]|nr:hypothetical protein [Candidatus Saccharibacteria bacterium]